MITMRELIENADDAYYATDYDKAIGLYKQALGLDSDNTHAQEQIRKAEFYLSVKGVRPEDLMAEALKLYKRSRSFIAIGDLDGAKALLQQAINFTEKAGMDFTNAKALLQNIQNATRAEEYKKKAYEELERQQWVRAEADLSIASDLDPTDHIVQELLPCLRSLLKAQNLALQLNSGFGNVRSRSKLDKEIQTIINRTIDVPVLRGLWQQVLDARHPKGSEILKLHAPKIFISYSHKDEIFKDELVTMLNGLQRRGIIDTWQDRRIEPGSDWFAEIEKAMKECEIAVLLVSSDFLASRFVQEVELNQLFQRRIEQGLRVVPIIIRSCLWQEEPVIKDLQALPKDGKPVISFSKENGERDQVWTDISKAIENVAKNL